MTFTKARADGRGLSSGNKSSWHKADLLGASSSLWNLRSTPSLQVIEKKRRGWAARVRSTNSAQSHIVTPGLSNPFSQQNPRPLSQIKAAISSP